MDCRKLILISNLNKPSQIHKKPTMPMLFMNKMRVSVPEGTVLTFLPNEEGVPNMTENNKHRVRFGIGGVFFDTSEDVATFIRNSFFATYLANPMNAGEDDTEILKQRVLAGPPFQKAELFPLIFDFMVRKRENCSSVLRTVMLTPEQSKELDEIENYIFPHPEPIGKELPASVTGPKYLLHPTTGHVVLALLPSYRPDYTGRMEASHGGDLVYHENSDVCKDPRFVQMVVDYENSPRKKKHTFDTEMIAHLNKEYDIQSRPITEDIIKNCNIVYVERGEPFAILSDEEDGVCFLSVVTELEGGIEWSVA